MSALAFLKTSLASVIAMVCSVAISMVIGYYVPHVTSGSSAPPAPVPGTVYTLEELNRAEAAAKARMEQQRRDFAAQPFAEVLRAMQFRALWGTWVPWLLLPFVFFIGSIKQAVHALLVPLLMTVAGIAPVEGFFVFAAALAAGVGARRALRGQRRAT